MSTLGSVRRYYLAKRHAAEACGEKALELVWASKQEAEPGESLPTDFPYRERLAARAYTTTQDLIGADEQELVDQGFSTRESTEILAAL